VANLVAEVTDALSEEAEAGRGAPADGPTRSVVAVQGGVQ
jgi:hypothetical protein